MEINEAIQQLTKNKAHLLYVHMLKLKVFVAETKTGIYKENRIPDKKRAEQYIAHVELYLQGYWDRCEYKGCKTAFEKLYAIDQNVNMGVLKTLAGQPEFFVNDVYCNLANPFVYPYTKTFRAIDQ